MSKALKFLADDKEKDGEFDAVEAEIIDLINKTKSFLYRELKELTEEDFFLVGEKKHILCSSLVEDHRRFIYGKLEDIKSLFILHVREVIWSPSQNWYGMLDDLRVIISG